MLDVWLCSEWVYDIVEWKWMLVSIMCYPCHLFYDNPHDSVSYLVIICAGVTLLLFVQMSPCHYMFPWFWSLSKMANVSLYIQLLCSAILTIYLIFIKFDDNKETLFPWLVTLAKTFTNQNKCIDFLQQRD